MTCLLRVCLHGVAGSCIGAHGLESGLEVFPNLARFHIIIIIGGNLVAIQSRLYRTTFPQFSSDYVLTDCGL